MGEDEIIEEDVEEEGELDELKGNGMHIEEENEEV